MSNIALEEKIRNLSADYIYQQAVGSLLLLLMSAMEDAEKGVTALPYEIPADVQEIKEEIQAYLIRLRICSKAMPHPAWLHWRTAWS